MANRKDNGRFAPGISGNPGGRPKLPAEMKEIFQAKGPEAAEILVKHLHASDPRVSVAAAREIFIISASQIRQRVQNNEVAAGCG